MCELHLASHLYMSTLWNGTFPVVQEVCAARQPWDEVGSVAYSSAWSFLLSEMQCVHFEVGLPVPADCVPPGHEEGANREPSTAFCTFALEPLGLGPESSTGGLQGEHSTGRKESCSGGGDGARW